MTFPTSEKFASRISAAGAECLNCPILNPSSEDWGIYDQASYIVDKLSIFYEKNIPDAIVYDLASLAGPVLTSRLELPGVKVSVYFPPNEAVPNYSQSFRSDIDRIHNGVKRFFEQYGVSVRDQEPTIYLFPTEFAPSKVGDDKYLYAGRCVGEQLPFGSWSNARRDHRPIALVTTSTTYVQGTAYFRMCTDALADLGWRVILSIPDDTDPSVLYPLPPDFEIVQKTSHTRILPFANLLIFNGGIITSSEAAYHGVPMVITSCGVEELEHLADNLVGLGLGIHLRNSEMNSESLRNCAVKVLKDSTILRNVEQLRRSFHRQPGAEEAANRIEEYIEIHK